MTYILVVDDDAGMAETMVDIFEDLGYAVDAASDGHKALEMVRDHAYDIALIDIKMPGINGVDTFKQVKDISPDTRVAMMTAFTTDELIDEAYHEGATEVFFKPLELDRVMAFVAGAPMGAC